MNAKEMAQNVSTHIHRIDESEISAAGNTLALAFEDEPLFSHVIPDSQTRAGALPKYFSILARFGYLFGEAWATTHLEGVAIWQPPGSDITAERAELAGFSKLEELLGREALVRLGTVLDHLETTHRSDVPKEHWYLMTIGVSPDLQGRGVGKALLEPILTRCDESSLPIYLDTVSESNISFYEGLGFRISFESVEPSSGLEFRTMMRAPTRSG